MHIGTAFETGNSRLFFIEQFTQFFLIDAESNLKAALQGMRAPTEEKPQ